MIRGKQGMFGGGIYFAESPQVAQHKALHKGKLLTCKVFVGKEFTLNAYDPKYANVTFKDLQKMGYDSVYAPKGSGVGEAEIVVYNYDQVCILKSEDC